MIEVTVLPEYINIEVSASQIANDIAAANAIRAEEAATASEASETVSTTQAGIATTKAIEADQSATTAATAAGTAITAKTDAETARDVSIANAEQTALDRIATGEDRVATGEDRVQTGLDRVQTGEDRVQTGLDRVQTGLDRVQTGLDRVQTGEDRVQTGEDRVATGEDRVATGEDVIAAQLSESNAEAFKIAAGISEDNAALSETAAAGSAIEATTQAGIATAQAGIATTQASLASSIILQGVYGVEWNRTFATQVCTRVGDMTLHNAITGLPVQSRIRKCLMMDDGVVNYYLNPSNSLLRADGFASNLDGTDGQVMMEIPEHWRRFDVVGNIQRVQISEASFAGSHRVPNTYISAFEASLFRPTSKLSSVINTSVDYRGGNNTAAWDLENRTLLGMPATNISRTNFTAYARNRGPLWDQYLYEAHKTLFWLYTIEYATRSSQLAFNSDLTVDNFRQGGLGDGVTNIVSSAWGNFNSYNPFIACGAGGLDDFTSSLAITHPVLGATQIPKYRGIEHPFGHIWKWTEGINIRAGNGRNMIYKANSNNFRSGDYQGYSFAGDQASANGFIRELTFGKDGDILAGSTSGASATTFWGDQLFQSIPATGEILRGLIFGGSAHSGSSAGFVFSASNIDPSHSSAGLGSRLSFIGA